MIRTTIFFNFRVTIRSNIVMAGSRHKRQKTDDLPIFFDQPAGRMKMRGSCKAGKKHKWMWLSKVPNTDIVDFVLTMMVLSPLFPAVNHFKVGFADGTSEIGAIYMLDRTGHRKPKPYMMTTPSMSKRVIKLSEIDLIEYIPLIPSWASECTVVIPGIHVQDFIHDAIQASVWVMGWLRTSVRKIVQSSEYPKKNSTRHFEVQRECWQVHRATFLYLFWCTFMHCRFSPDIHIGRNTYDWWMNQPNLVSLNDVQDHWVHMEYIPTTMVEPTDDFLFNLGTIAKPGQRVLTTSWRDVFNLLWRMSLRISLTHASRIYTDGFNQIRYLGGQICVMRSDKKMQPQPSNGILNADQSNYATLIDSEAHPYVGILGRFACCVSTRSLLNLIYHDLQPRRDCAARDPMPSSIWMQVASWYYCKNSLLSNPYDHPMPHGNIIVQILKRDFALK